MLGIAGKSQMVGVVSPVKQALQVHQTRSCCALDPASDSDRAGQQARIATVRALTPSSCWRALAQASSWAHRRPPHLHTDPCHVSHPISHNPTNNALRVSNTIWLRTVLVLQDAEGSFREGVPSFGSATHIRLDRAGITRLSSPTVRRRWSRECHSKDGGAAPLLSLTR